MNTPDVTPIKEKNFNIGDPLFQEDFITTLYEWLPKNREIVIACVGTDRSTGDSYGPFVGSMLEEQGEGSFHVLGTIEEPLHAVNLEERIKEVKMKYRNPFIIAVDACLGSVSHIGSLTLAKGPLAPGAALKKDLPKVGDVHINGIVNVQGFMEFAVLQNTRLKTVIDLSSATVSALHGLEEKWKQNRSVAFPSRAFSHIRKAQRTRLANDA
ncbi:spore protease YyaC [Salimicrobium halophilum]|uniref:Putative sporulation protein YyaC n=1 Tax=Salimicrobium halophilum TaxID=86666 RepID=A0A1G8UQX2_9BACI|nr:spore protease YyaC [Salimicrobium halophilum]SDJ56193.1 putative sporulation protein YyaC [Salimicrobium halophilum]